VGCSVVQCSESGQGVTGEGRVVNVFADSLSAFGLRSVPYSQVSPRRFLSPLALDFQTTHFMVHLPIPLFSE
jgi:hypothetical protein